MNRPWVLGLGAAAALVLSLGAGDLFAGASKDKDKKGPHLRYSHSFAEAWTEAKARNTLLFVTFHKDH
jgi:hypothetical protein